MKKLRNMLNGKRARRKARIARKRQKQMGFRR